jgi:hypothetical protein
MTVGHALQDVLQVGVGLAGVELGGGDQRADDRPAVGATIGAGEPFCQGDLGAVG